MIKTDSFILTGGIDLQTPYLALKSGKLIDSVNYETLPFGGYRRIDGYSLYDGKSTNQQPVPGESSIRGVWIFKGKAYAFRDQATAGGMFVESASGWTAVAMPNYLLYDGGSQTFSEGQTITGATSGATAVIVRANIDSGSTGSSSLAGLLVLSNITGTFQNDEVLKVGAVNYAVANGTVTAYQLPKGGDYEFWNYNFLGNAASQRMYGVNGVGMAFEFDGTTFVPINQTFNGHYPNHIVGHSDHLFLGFESDGVSRNSATGFPRDFRSTGGAADIGVGDELRQYRPMVGGVLMIGSANSVKILYGQNSSNWVLKRYSDHGIRSRTMREIGGTVVVLDSRGVQRLDQTADFGDFTSLAISVPINKRLLPFVQQNASAVSVVSKQKDQYRIFFGKSAYYFCFNAGKLVGITPVSFAHNVVNAADGIDQTNAEFIIFGSDDGMVFRMNSGFKFHTTNIQSALQMVFNYEGSPSQRKHFRKATFFIEYEGAAQSLTGRSYYSLGADPAPGFQTLAANQAAGARWDVATWDNFEWSNDYGSEISLQLDGTGYSVSVAVYGSGEEQGLHTLQSAVIHYSPRRFSYAA